MNDLLFVLAIAVLVGAICAVVLFGIQRCPRLADPPPRRSPFWSSDPSDIGD